MKHNFELLLTESLKHKISKFNSDIRGEILDEWHDEDMLKAESFDDKLSKEEAEGIRIKFFRDCIAYIEELNYDEVIAKLPKKKNGTLYKNSVTKAIKEPMGYLSDEEYGYRRLALRWKNTSDTTSELDIVSYVEQF